MEGADNFSTLHHRNNDLTAVTQNTNQFDIHHTRIVQRINHMDEGAICDREANYAAGSDRVLVTKVSQCFIGEAVSSREVRYRPIKIEDATPYAVTKQHRISCDSLEDALGIAARASNELQDFSGCRLPSSRLG